MAAGVYKIMLAGRIYVGSSVDMDRRWYEHLKHLRARKHHSRHLQRAFDKHGDAAALSFEVLETVEDESQLIAREQFYLDALRPFGKNGFNSYPVAASTKGRRWTDEMREAARIRVESCFRTPEAIALAAKNRTGLKQSEETKSKRSETLKKIAASRPDWGTWNRGKKKNLDSVARMRASLTGRINGPPSIETREKMRAALTGKKRTPEQVERIRQAQLKKWQERRAEASWQQH